MQEVFEYPKTESNFTAVTVNSCCYFPQLIALSVDKGNSRVGIKIHVFSSAITDVIPEVHTTTEKFAKSKTL